ncbi:MAG TPA: hypothetical protein VIP51_15630 [Eoetvoesiella sp.]
MPTADIRLTAQRRVRNGSFNAQPFAMPSYNHHDPYGLSILNVQVMSAGVRSTDAWPPLL